MRGVIRVEIREVEEEQEWSSRKSSKGGICERVNIRETVN